MQSCRHRRQASLSKFQVTHVHNSSMVVAHRTLDTHNNYLKQEQKDSPFLRLQAARSQ